MKSYHILLFCCALALTISMSATDKDADKEKNKPEKVIKYSNLKKHKAVSTGDKVYTWIDASGNRVYSQEPRKGAELMKIEEGTNYSPPSTDTARNYSTMKPKVVSSNTKYTRFAIVSPSNEATIRNNNGNFQVALDIRPRLGNGHSIKLQVDGKTAATVKSSIASLNNVDRGEHSLIATIVDSNGEIIKSTAPVIIYLHRGAH